MKKAKKIIVTIEFKCPYCDSGYLQNPDGGSFHFLVCEIIPETAICADCDKESRTK